MTGFVIPCVYGSRQTKNQPGATWILSAKTE
jgi:hypothetical protein